MKTHFPKRCPVVMKYMLFSAEPYYSVLVASCILSSLKERWPLTSSLQVISSAERTAWDFNAPPWPGLTKGHLVSVQDLFENYLNHRDEEGQYFTKTKSLMTYFTVGLTFCLGLFCVPLGVPLNTKSLFCLSYKLSGTTWQHCSTAVQSRLFMHAFYFQPNNCGN